MRNRRFFERLSFIAALFVSLLSGTQVFASGFTCLSVDRDTRINIMTDHPNAGQIAQSLIVIDPSASTAKQVIATFAINDGLLQTTATEFSTLFTAHVDTSFPGSSRAGRKVGGTNLGSLESISLEVQTVTERRPTPLFDDGSMFAAQAIYKKKNGQELKQDFDCLLFLSESMPPNAFDL